MTVATKASIHIPVTIKPVGKIPSDTPGTMNGVGRPCAAAMILSAGLSSRYFGSVRFPPPVVNRPATKNAPVELRFVETCCEELAESLM
jgi:hypothetical protein